MAVSPIQSRKQRWLDFYDLSSSRRIVFIIRYAPDLPARPRPNPERRQERIEWIWQLRPMARFDKPQNHFKRSASLIFRMDNLSCDIATSWNYSRCRLPHFEKIIQRYFTPSDSAPCRPSIPVIPKKWTACSGIGGRLAPESVVAFDRITHQYVSNARNCGARKRKLGTSGWSAHSRISAIAGYLSWL